ncbi:MAG: lipoate--protein ligase family protein [Bacteroidetes bacterium]|nr:lipoate--protein ligase family protein [Bacteroidota bacterium]
MNVRLIDVGEVSYLQSQTIYHALAYAKTPETPDTIILDSPREPYVCIGFHRDLNKEIDVDYCRDNGIPIIRRETGGGMVFLDADQLFIQWIFEPEHFPGKIDSRFKLFIKPLVETYKFFGINAHYHPPNDVHVKNKKIVGTGAATIGNAEVVTGNFLFDFDCFAMAKVLKVPSEIFRDAIHGSLQQYMTSMKKELGTIPDRVQVKKKYIEKCGEVLGRKIVLGDFTRDELDMIDVLNNKFVKEEWLYQFHDKRSRNRVVKIHAGVWLFEITHKTKGGEIHLIIRTKGQLIDLIKISGDIEFRPAGKLKGFENVLRNVELSEVSLLEMIEAFYELHRIETPGITVQDWVAAILRAKNS